MVLMVIALSNLFYCILMLINIYFLCSFGFYDRPIIRHIRMNDQTESSSQQVNLDKRKQLSLSSISPANIMMDSNISVSVSDNISLVDQDRSNEQSIIPGSSISKIILDLIKKSPNPGKKLKDLKLKSSKNS